VDESSLPWRETPSADDSDWEPTLIGKFGSDPKHPCHSDDLDDESPTLNGHTSPWSNSSLLEDQADAHDVTSAWSWQSNHPEGLDLDRDVPSASQVSSSRQWNSMDESSVMESEVVSSDDTDNLRQPTEVNEKQSITHTSATNKEDDDEDSIEAYMNRLLQRVQGSSPTDSIPGSSTTVTLPPVPSKVEKPTSTKVEELPPIDPNAPLVPRSHAPEKQLSLSAMREIAHESAQAAISRSTRIQIRDMQLLAYGKFGSGLGLAICALAFFMYVRFPASKVIAGAMFVLAAVAVHDGRKLLLNARTRLEQAEAAAAAGKELSEDLLESEPVSSETKDLHSAHPE
jgi:hypothetical protein